VSWPVESACVALGYWVWDLRLNESAGGDVSLCYRRPTPGAQSGKFGAKPFPGGIFIPVVD